jgi:hypothetical protein
MAKPTTRKQFKDYCLRRLGWPVIDINVDEDQLEDRIDDALSYYYDYHFDGTEKIYMKHRITQEDIDRRWIYCPDAVIFVTGMIPFDQSSSSTNMFDLRYQLRLHDLYDFTSVSYVSYEITMQHLRTLNLLFSGTPQFRFNRHQNKLMLDIDWSRDVQPGEYVVMECYRKLNPDTVILTGTVNLTTTSNTVIGTNTRFDQEILENDMVTFGSNLYQVRSIKTPTEIVLASAPTANASNVTMTVAGTSDVWNDRFLKAYATQKIKYQWGSNLSKFAGVQLPGGVTLDGPRIMDEAKVELDKLEEEMHSLNVLPSDMYMG